MEQPRVSVIVTAYNEGESIVTCLDRIFDVVKLPVEVLVVFDSPDDTTVPWVEKYAERRPAVVPTLNTYGPGPARAIHFGVDTANAPVAVVTMADGCDDPQQIDALRDWSSAAWWSWPRPATCSGGQQVGGPVLKATLSRWAGRSLHLLARVGTHDATNSFKAYERAFVQEVGINSDDGFEVGIELVAKARRLRLPVAEVPTIWLDRSFGVSNFKLARWLPRYLYWYRFAFGPALTVEQLKAKAHRGLGRTDKWLEVPTQPSS